MPLSDVAIRKAKATDKVQRLFDGFGLYLEVTPAGSKLFPALSSAAARAARRVSAGSSPFDSSLRASSRRSRASAKVTVG